MKKLIYVCIIPLLTNCGKIGFGSGSSSVSSLKSSSSGPTNENAEVATSSSTATKTATANETSTASATSTATRQSGQQVKEKYFSVPAGYPFIGYLTSKDKELEAIQNLEYKCISDNCATLNKFIISKNGTVNFTPRFSEIGEQKVMVTAAAPGFGPVNYLVTLDVRDVTPIPHDINLWIYQLEQAANPPNTSRFKVSLDDSSPVARYTVHLAPGSREVLDQTINSITPGTSYSNPFCKIAKSDGIIVPQSVNQSGNWTFIPAFQDTLTLSCDDSPLKLIINVMVP